VPHVGFPRMLDCGAKATLGYSEPHPISYLTFIMTVLSRASTFHTFHNNTAAIPAEITTQILSYIVADARPLPLGGGVRTHSTTHPIASVSQTFRSIYLDHPYSTSTTGRATAPVKLSIGEALEDNEGQTPLSWAAGNGHQTVVKLLQNTDKVKVNLKDIEWRTPLSRAAENGHGAVVRLLLDTGKVMVNSKDMD
jgi:hypothetical protein